VSEREKIRGGHGGCHQMAEALQMRLVFDRWMGYKRGTVQG
jgi:hypothetical protein